MSRSDNLGRGLAKVLGIKPENYRPRGKEEILRGESTYSVDSADTFVEPEVTTAEYLREYTPGGKAIGRFFWHLFPFLHWIGKYNLTWFTGDMIAGVTVGAVVIPQSMAYALLAKLPAEYGLYSSFMGVIIYWFFATSKDITIGPVAVASTLVGTIIINVQASRPDVPPEVIAQAAAVIAGVVIFGMGFFQLGFFIEMIPLTAISAFMTGSAINIAVGQVPNLMGLSSDRVNSRDSTYLVIINSLKALPTTKLDAAMGLTALFLLYFIRWFCNFMTKRYPKYRKTFFFANTLRTVFVILLYTLVSWLANKDVPKSPKFKILLNVPRGFAHAGAPRVDKEILGLIASQLPVLVIVLLIEHIAISKSFGRVNHYKIDPSQEMVAIGVTNLLGPFLGAYPATGSFSRTAIKSKAGVRTPFAGVITGIVVLIAIYALTAVFYYISLASLAAVIIHAVGDLITPPKTVYQFWRVSPFEVFIFFVGVLVTVFSGIENGIYCTISIAAFFFLFRVVKAKGRFPGRVRVRDVRSNENPNAGYGATGGKSVDSGDSHGVQYRDLFLPIDHNDGSNPNISVQGPYPGIFIFRFTEPYNYPSANHYTDQLVATVFEETRRTTSQNLVKLGDRPWNDPRPRNDTLTAQEAAKPTLKALVLDFAAVNNVDITSVQNLIDVRNQLDRWAFPNHVDWHFANIHNRWTRRALASAGFGTPTPPGPHERWKPLFSVADIGGADSAAADAQYRDQKQVGDIEAHSANSSDEGIHKGGYQSELKQHGSGKRHAIVGTMHLPLFHPDLTSALDSAIENAEAQTSASGANPESPVYDKETVV